MNDHKRMTAFVWRAVAAVGAVGAALVVGTWLFGELAMRLVYGSKFATGGSLLVLLAVMAALYLLSELLNQVLFARGLAWGAAAAWTVGIVVAAGVTVGSQGRDRLQSLLHARLGHADDVRGAGRLPRGYGAHHP